MAENKKSFLIYIDWINIFEELSDEEAGKLVKHLFRYVNDLNPEFPDRLTKLLFEPIKQTLKRDLIKYENRKTINKNNAMKKWGSSLAELNDEKRSQRLSIARKKATHSKEEWIEMINFFGKCVKCGASEKIVKDHIIPIYQGGSDGIDNLQPLCEKCNSSKGPENVDYRQIYCLNNACEMPAKWVQMPIKPADSDIDIDIDSDIEKEKEEKKSAVVMTRKSPESKNGYSSFYVSELEKSKQNPDYFKVVKILHGENNLGIPLKSVLKMEDQLSFNQFQKIWYLRSKYKFSITDILESMEDWKNIKTRKTVYKTFLTFLKNNNPSIKIG